MSHKSSIFVNLITNKNIAAARVRVRSSVHSTTYIADILLHTHATNKCSGQSDVLRHNATHVADTNSKGVIDINFHTISTR